MLLGMFFYFCMVYCFFARETAQLYFLRGLLDVDVDVEAAYWEYFDEPNVSLNRHTKSVPPSPAAPFLSVSWLTGNRTTADSQPCLVGQVPAPPVKLRPSAFVDPTVRATCPTGNHHFGSDLQCVAATGEIHPARRRLTMMLDPAVHPRVLSLRLEAGVFNPKRTNRSSINAHQYLVVPEKPADVVATSGAVASSGRMDEQVPSENRDLRGSVRRDLAGGSTMEASDCRYLKLPQVSEAMGLSCPVKSKSVAPVGKISDEIECDLSASVGENPSDGSVGKLVPASESEGGAEKKLLASEFDASNDLVTGRSSVIPVVKLGVLAAKGRSILGSTMWTSDCGCNNALPVSEATCGSEKGINWPLNPVLAEKCGEPGKFDSTISLGEAGNRSDLGSGGCTLPTAVPSGRLQSGFVGFSGAVKGGKVRKSPRYNDIAKFSFPVRTAEQAERWLDALCRSPGWFHRGRWGVSWKKMMAVQWQWNQLNPLQQNDTVALKHSASRRRHVASQFFVTLAETQFLLECMKEKKCRGPKWYCNWISRTMENIFSPRLSSAELTKICYAIAFGPTRHRRRGCSTVSLNLVERMNQAVLMQIQNKALLPGHYLLSVNSPPLEVRVVPAANVTIRDEPIPAEENPGLIQGPNHGGPVPEVGNPGLLAPVDEMHPDLRRCFAEAPNRPYLFRRRPRYQPSDSDSDDETSVDVLESQRYADVSARQSTSMDAGRGPISYGRRPCYGKRRRCQAEQGESKNATDSEQDSDASPPKVKREVDDGMDGGALAAMKNGSESEDSSDDENWADFAEHDSA